MKPVFKGAALVTCAMVLFVQNDVATKLLTERLATLQVMIARGAIGAVALYAILRLTRAPYRWRQAVTIPVALRSLCDALASLCFVLALAEMPIATLTAIMMLAPVVSAVAGALLYQEALTPRLGLSTALGFAGVLLFARPDTAGVGHGTLLASAATVLLSARDLLTRRMALTVSSSFVALTTTIAVPVVLVPFAASSGYAPMTWGDVLLLAYAGVFAAVGNWMLVQATRIASLAEIAPFRYAAIPASLVAGSIVWSENPDWSMIAGSVLITAGGILALGNRKPLSRRT